MKKITKILFAVMLMVSVTVTGAVAANGNPGTNYTDKNGDGICDWYKSGCNSVREAGEKGQNFVDENGDGACDNYVSCNNGKKHGKGQYAKRRGCNQNN